MRLVKGQARLSLPKALYRRESLEAAALAVAGRCEIYLEQDRRRWTATLKAAPGCSAALLRRAAGDFLNEALGHGYRQKVVRFNAESTRPALGYFFARAFPAPRPDPLEELEPQVALDREAETKALLEAARA